MTAPSLEDILLRAAVCGRFDPARLLADCDDTAFVDFSGKLAKVCDEVISARDYGWRLRAPDRRAALARLASADMVRAVLAETERLADETDPFAHEFRQLLRGRIARRADGRDDRLTASLLAAPIPALADKKASIEKRAEDLRRAIEIEQADAALSFALPPRKPLFGRASDLARLERYALGGDAPTLDPRPIVVSGDGGVGKSALLVSLIRKLRRGRPGVAVALIDFDRPNLASGDPVEILREILRNLERALPHAMRNQDDLEPVRTALSAARARLVSRRRVEKFAATPGGEQVGPEQAAIGSEVVEIHAEEQFSIATSQLSELADVIPASIKTAPILVVLDTFEIAVMRGPDTVERTLDLLRHTRERYGFSGLRAILSGRALEDKLDSEAAPGLTQDLAPPDQWIRLAGVNPRSGAAILAHLDKDFGRLPEASQRLAAARALEGHPLALKILHMYVRDKKPGAIEKLLGDLRHDEGFARETALKFLYGRILDRISVKDVKKIARPGLILRRVSPDLIRLVLAGPCELGPIDAAGAVKLFGELTRNYWLLEGVADGVARHRSDLRRLMAAALLVEMPEKARAMNRLAADYYESGPPAGDGAYENWKELDPDDRDAEAFYHRALAQDPAPPELERGRAQRIRDRLGEDLNMLELPWRVVVLASAGSFGEIDISAVDSAVIGSLSPSLRDRLIFRKTEAMLASGEAARAQETLNLRRTARKGGAAAGARAAKSLGKESALRVRAAFGRVDIAQAVTEAIPLLDAYFSDSAPAWLRSAKRGYWSEDDPVWLAALAVAALRPEYRPPADVVALVRKNPVDIALFVMAPMFLTPEGVASLAAEMRSNSFYSLLQRAKFLDIRALGAALSVFGEDALLYGDKPAIHPLTRVSMPCASLKLLLAALHGRHSEDLPLGLEPKTRERLGALESRGSATKAQIDSVYDTHDGLRWLGDQRGAFPVAGRLPMPLLRGLTPELHEPTAFLLRGKASAEIDAWIEDVAARERWWPVDLRFSPPGGKAASKSASPEKGRRPRFENRDAYPVVVSADRCGLLKELLQWLGARDPRGRDLLAIHDVVTDRLFTLRDKSFTGRIS